MEKFCGELKKQLTENSLNNNFLPLANIFTASPSSASSKSYTKKKKQKKEKSHEGKGENGYYLCVVLILCGLIL